MPDSLLYAQVREDPQIDLEVLRVQPNDRILTVTSGGCTALTLLAQGPEELVALDRNPIQNYLLELKLAAIRTLPLNVCRGFFGARQSKDRLKLYGRLSEQLSPEARNFWDQHPQMLQRGLLHAGRTEAMCRVLRRFLFWFVHPPGRLRALFRQKDLSQQKQFYQVTWNNRRWRWFLKAVFNPATFRFLYGGRFFRRFQEGDLTSAWTRKIERAFAELPIHSNYFLSQLLWDRGLPGEAGLPPYLRQGVFERVRAHADRLQWHTGDLTEYLKQSGSGKFSKMTLSNALEWLPDEESETAFGAVADSLRPQGRAVLRHLLGETPLPGNLPLQVQPDLSRRMTSQERAFLYSQVSVYERV